MTRLQVWLAAAALTGAAALAAAAPRVRPFDPPTAEQLGLSGAAAAQWSGLRTQTISLRDAARGAARQRLDALRQLLASAAPDLDAFSRASEQQIDAHIAQARALKAQQLALYDSLPASQRAQVRAVMLQRLDRLQHLRAALAELAEAAP